MLKKWSLTVLILLFVANSRLKAQCMSANFTPGAIYTSTGDATLDQRINSESSSIGQLFGVHPVLRIFNDGQSPNALSSPQGVIFIGRSLLVEELWAMNKGGAAVAGIIAHEMAHQMKYMNGSELPTREKELQADFMAGFYLGRKSYVTNAGLENFAESLFEKGDYDFTSPTHHGTPEERVAAMSAGFRDRNVTTSQAFTDGETFVLNNGIRASRRSRQTDDDGDSTYTGRSSRRTTIVQCTHPAHPNGDLVPCVHVCPGPYGPVPCHRADVVACSHPMHPNGDVISVP
jgi:hypothetical protein